jgi:hypothetical protein
LCGILVFRTLRFWTFFFEAMWKIKCTDKERMYWMNPKRGSLDQVKLLTKDMLQLVRQEVYYAGIYRAANAVQCEVFYVHQVSTCA